MPVTRNQVKEIRTYLESIKPETVELRGNRPMTMKECIFALAPALERMRKRGFLPAGITGLLKAKGVDVKEATLAKYLSEYRRRKGKKNSGQTAAARKRGTPGKSEGAPANPAQPAGYLDNEYLAEMPLDEL